MFSWWFIYNRYYFVGFVGGSSSTIRGAGADPICLPRDPQWGIYKDGFQELKTYLLGAEYKTRDFNYNFRGIHDYRVPCAVCLVRDRSVVKMFPGNIKYQNMGYFARKRTCGFCDLFHLILCQCKHISILCSCEFPFTPVDYPVIVNVRFCGNQRESSDNFLKHCKDFNFLIRWN